MPFAPSSAPTYKRSPRYMLVLLWHSPRPAAVQPLIPVWSSASASRPLGRRPKSSMPCLGRVPMGSNRKCRCLWVHSSCSHGSYSLQRSTEPVRRSKRADVKDEPAGVDNATAEGGEPAGADNAVAEDGNAVPGPSVFGNSISQCKSAVTSVNDATHIRQDVRSLPKSQVAPAAQNAVAAPSSRSAAPPPPLRPVAPAAHSPLEQHKALQPDDDEPATASSPTKAARLGESPTGDPGMHTRLSA